MSQLINKTVRILTIPLPADEILQIALLRIEGLGSPRIAILLKHAKLSHTRTLQSLRPFELSRLIHTINYFRIIHKWALHTTLSRLRSKIIRKIIKNKSFRGLRHQLHLPVRGQRTRSNAKTVRRIKHF